MVNQCNSNETLKSLCGMLPGMQLLEFAARHKHNVLFLGETYLILCKQFRLPNYVFIDRQTCTRSRRHDLRCEGVCSPSPSWPAVAASTWSAPRSSSTEFSESTRGFCLHASWNVSISFEKKKLLSSWNFGCRILLTLTRSHGMNCKNSGMSNCNFKRLGQ